MRKDHGVCQRQCVSSKDDEPAPEPAWRLKRYSHLAGVSKTKSTVLPFFLRFVGYEIRALACVPCLCPRPTLENSHTLRRNCFTCPWMNMKPDDKVIVAPASFHRYGNALWAYTLGLIYRLGKRYGVDIDAKIRRQRQEKSAPPGHFRTFSLKRHIEGTDGKFPHAGPQYVRKRPVCLNV
jgi:hypothetical protein